MDTMEALLTRRSRRTFTDEPVSEEQIRAMIEAGMFAPSGHNFRTWRFLTITDRKLLQQMATLTKPWFPLREAALAVIVCTDDTKYYEMEGYVPGMEVFGIENAAAASENILLAAHALGLGGVWLNIAPCREQYTAAVELLGIPENILPVSVLAIGHPADAQPEPRGGARYEPEKWYKEQWGNAAK